MRIKFHGFKQALGLPEERGVADSDFKALIDGPCTRRYVETLALAYLDQWEAAEIVVEAMESHMGFTAGDTLASYVRDPAGGISSTIAERLS